MMDQLRVTWHEIAMKTAMEAPQRELAGVNIAG
jgi:hypothetical protein